MGKVRATVRSNSDALARVVLVTGLAFLAVGVRTELMGLRDGKFSRYT